ncbi:ribosomal protein S3AE [Pseudomonas oryzihabitans]|nr:ribosomal protein S3AE [Pseudomonas psychrotolerans]
MAVLRTPCPPAVCTCERERVLADPHLDARALLLNRTEEQRLLARLEGVASLADLQRLQQRLLEQLGIRLEIAPGLGEVRSARGLVIELQHRPGLCRKLHQSIPAAIRRGLTQRPEILYELLNANDLLRDA